MTRLLAYYGDDFTGSTDVMEALASRGVKTALFTALPSAEEFAPFADYEAIGLAGTSRSETPDWMDRHLPEAFAWLKSLDTRFCHYKVCSTFDSSPAIGSIGRAVEIGHRIFGQHSSTLLLGAPQIKRYTFAGHLFAAFQGQVYRIDRHPVMSVHPVTPMDESDVLRHLSRQTAAPVELIDVHDEQSQLAAGHKLLQLPGDHLPFVVGSSGVEYALMEALQRKVALTFEPVVPVGQMLIISGSVSPTTARQIDYAKAHGFTAVEANAVDLARGNIQVALETAHSLLAEGHSPLIHSAVGPESDMSQALRAIPKARENLSRALGQIACRLIESFGLRRLVIAGGDTSSHALRELDIHALTMRYPLVESPGSPLCTVHSRNPVFSGITLALKGGQVGRDDYFVKLRQGLP